MSKGKILALLGFAFDVAGIEWGRAQGKKIPGFYELRVYTAETGKGDALAARFAAAQKRFMLSTELSTWVTGFHSRAIGSRASARQNMTHRIKVAKSPKMPA